MFLSSFNTKTSSVPPFFSKILFNGLGSELADINGTLHKAMSSETFYWYVDPDMDIEKKTSKFIRSEVK